jgi:hypothetical protein
MSKIIIAVLTTGAFVFAAWLVLAGRQLPNPRKAKGLQRRFILATLLFVGLLGAGGGSGPPPTCYAPPALPNGASVGQHRIAATLKAVWRTLDPNRSEEFRKKLEAAAGEGAIRRKTANMLSVAFSELAYHKYRTRGQGRLTTCYKMTPLGGTLYKSREQALNQIELLGKARQSGAIDAETAAKAHAVLAREVEMLGRAKAADSPDFAAQERLRKQYESGRIIAGDSASVASAIIVEMEDGKVPNLMPAERLSVIKERVEKLLKDGPATNDWIDPDIQPNVSAVLAKAGLIDKQVVTRFTCYDRDAGSVQARTDELKRLQEELLDKNVKAGVLEVEVAQKAAAATAREPEVDYATERDIRHYQKRLRRAVRLLYRRGEVPSWFVQELQEAADIEIIHFDPAKALRNDMRYHVRSAFWGPEGDEVLKLLEGRKLVPKRRNHRLVMRGLAVPEDTKKKLAEFERLIDSEMTFELEGDEGIRIEDWRIGEDDKAYRFRMRRVCRALVKTGLVHDTRSLGRIEELIGIAIVGRLE